MVFAALTLERVRWGLLVRWSLPPHCCCPRESSCSRAQTLLGTQSWRFSITAPHSQPPNFTLSLLSVGLGLGVEKLCCKKVVTALAGGQECFKLLGKHPEKDVLRHRHVPAAGVIQLFCKYQLCLGDTEEQDRTCWWGSPGQ